MASIIIFPFFIFIIATSSISSIESTGTLDEIGPLLEREESIKFLLANYVNFNLDIDNLYWYFNSYIDVDDLKSYEEYDGKVFLKEYVEKFGHFAQNQKSSELAKKFELNELAQKMVEELENLEANNLEKPISIDLDEQKEKLEKIEQEMRKIGNIMENNIVDKVKMSENDKNHPGIGYWDFDDKALSIKIQGMMLRYWYNAIEKIKEQYKMAMHLAMGKSKLSRQKTKFFVTLELNLVMFGQLLTIVDNITNQEKIAPLLKNIPTELNGFKDEMAKKLNVEGDKLEFISDIAGNFDVRQIMPGIFEKMMDEIEGLKNQIEKEKSEKHVKDIKHKETLGKSKWFIDEYKNDIRFNKYASIVEAQIGKMDRNISKLQAENVLVKGVENIRKSFDVLKEMKKLGENKG